MVSALVTVTGGGKLRADAAASYGRMLNAGMPPGGIDVFHRTMAQQQRLYDLYRAGKGPVAARPSLTAPHIAGRAMDYQTTRAGKYQPSAAHVWASTGSDGSKSPRQLGKSEYERANDFGWYRDVPSERWHRGYYPARDKARALKRGVKAKYAVRAAQQLLLRTEHGAPVKAAGGADGIFGPATERAVKAAQKSAGLVVDGVIGSRTWAALRQAATAPPPVAPPTEPTGPSPEEQGMFRFGWANLRAARFGGLPDGSPARADFLREGLNCSLYGLCEVPEAARAAIDKRLGATRWQLHPEGYVCNLWDSRKWVHSGRVSVSFGTGVHGAVCTVLTHRPTGRRLDVISLHVRPRDSFGQGASDATVAAGKAGDVERALRLITKGVPTIIAGDFNGAATDILTAAGLRRATPIVDTYDGKDGRQALDQVWITTGLEVRGHTLVPSGTVSDHSAWIVNLTILDPKAV